MTAVGTKVSGALTGQPVVTPDAASHIFLMSDGYEIALFSEGTSNYYAVYNGTSWNAAPTMFGTLSTYSVSGVCSLVQVANTIYIVRATPNVVTIATLPWNSSTHAMAAASTAQTAAGTYNTYAVDAVWDSAHSCFYIALGSTSSGQVQTVSATVSGSTVTVLHTATTSGMMTTPTAGGYGSYSITLAQNGQSAATLYLVGNTGVLQPITTGSGGTITTGATETWMASPGSTLIAIDSAFDNSGNLDLVYSRYLSLGAKASLNAIKRTGTGTYSGVTQLDSSAGGASTCGPSFALAYNSTSGDLWVFYQNTTTQANGELYLAKRTSGSWGASTRVVGGDASGYASPSALGTFSSTGADYIYVYGTSTSNWAAYVARQSLSSAPNTPVGLTPTGTTGYTATPPVPAFAWTYSNPTTGDGQGSYELHVVRTSDSVVMWDSGQVTGTASSGIVYGATSNTGDVNYVAPTNLVYGTQYQWTVKTWDAIGNLASSYSTALTFTPQQAPQAAITSLTSPSGGTPSTGSASSTLAASTLAAATSLTVQAGAGALFTTGDQIAVGVAPNIDLVTISSKATDTFTVTAMTHAHSSTDPVVQTVNTVASVTSTTFDLTVAVEQAAGDTITAYTATILDSTGTTTIATTSGTISTTPGSAFTITNWAPAGVLNSSTYLIQVQVTDGTTSLTGTSAQWTITTAFTPPAAPTGMTCALNTTAGTATLTWTNPGSISGNNVYWRASGTTPWTLVTSGTVRTSAVLFPPLATAYDFAVSAVNGLTIESALAPILNQTLGLKYGAYGVWLNDVDAPLVNSVALGGVEDWQSASLFDHVEDATSYVPAGRPAPITAYGLSDYWTAVQRKYFVPGSDTDGTTTTTGASVIAALTALNSAHEVVLYRDVTGEFRFMEIRNLHREILDSVHYIVQLDLSQVDVSTVPVI